MAHEQIVERHAHDAIDLVMVDRRLKRVWYNADKGDHQHVHAVDERIKLPNHAYRGGIQSDLFMRLALCRQADEQRRVKC